MRGEGEGEEVEAQEDKRVLIDEPEKEQAFEMRDRGEVLEMMPDMDLLDDWCEVTSEDADESFEGDASEKTRRLP